MDGPQGDFAFTGGVSVRALCCDEGREVYHVLAHDSSLVVKAWPQWRLAADQGANSLQAFNEMRLRLSSLGSSTDFVVPLRCTISREGGLLVFYPYGGRSMDVVCAELRAVGDKQELERVLSHMAAEVVLALQKLKALKPKALVHRDVKLDNILLGDDGKMRLADMGCLAPEGSRDTAHDPAYFPPDWATRLPDGRHTYEDPDSLAAVNTCTLDLRGLGMALLVGWAGHLPAEVAADRCDDFPPPASYSTYAWEVEDAPVKQQLREQQRLARIAMHDWHVSIDTLIPDCTPLNSLAKLLLGPLDQVPTLDALLKHEAIKPVMRTVLAVSRNTRKAWVASISNSTAAMWQLEAALVGLELQQQEATAAVTGNSSSSQEPLSLTEKFKMLHAQHMHAQQGSNSPSSKDSSSGGIDICAGSKATISSCGETRAAAGSKHSTADATWHSSGRLSSTSDGSSSATEGKDDSPSDGCSHIDGAATTPVSDVLSPDSMLESAVARPQHCSVDSRSKLLAELQSLRTQLAAAQAAAEAQESELARLRQGHDNQLPAWDSQGILSCHHQQQEQQQLMPPAQHSMEQSLADILPALTEHLLAADVQSAAGGHQQQGPLEPCNAAAELHVSCLIGKPAAGFSSSSSSLAGVDGEVLIMCPSSLPTAGAPVGGKATTEVVRGAAVSHTRFGWRVVGWGVAAATTVSLLLACKRKRA